MDTWRNPEKYTGKILGTKEEIADVLSTFKEKPKNIYEIEDVIFRERREALGRTLKKAEDSLW